MEFRQLKYFVAVAEELHFSRAAERCNISQPPFSQQIKALEEELGVVLLERTNRRVELTMEGREFLERAREILDAAVRAKNKMRALARGEQGVLRVGFVGPAALSRLPEAIRRFREENPKVTLNLSALSTVEQLGMLRENTLDVSFARLFGHDTSNLRTMLFLREPYEVALPLGHELALQERISFSQLRGVPMIFHQRLMGGATRGNAIGCSIRESILAAFHEAGFSPNIVQEVNTEQATIALVATGLGAAFVPASSARDQRTGVVYRPLYGNLPDWEITALWKKRRESALLTRFLDVVMQYRQVPCQCRASEK